MTGIPFTQDDHRWMTVALHLAKRGLGHVAPNPAVGCVLVKDGMPVGRGWTQSGGRPHAETEALARAGERARGSTAYVTLEPCSHYGKTGPCATALIEAGVIRAVVSIEDPDPRVAGRGLAMLRQSGIQVDVGLGAEEARRINAGFLSHRQVQRPLVTLKLATSLDGRIATQAGESKWITGPEARADAHLLRSRHDAVLVGIGTVLADDPRLTVRLPGIVKQPLRVVLDGKGRLPSDAALCDGSARTLQIVDHALDPLAGPHGVTRVCVSSSPTGLSIPDCLTVMADQDVTRVMIEGGGQVAAAFLNADVVDHIVWYRAGLVLGASGRTGIGALSMTALSAMPRFDLIERRRVGPDFVDELSRTR